MPAFTAYIDRDTNPRVRVTAATAAEARQYATGRYGKVLNAQRDIDLSDHPLICFERLALFKMFFNMVDWLVRVWVLV